LKGRVELVEQDILELIESHEVYKQRTKVVLTSVYIISGTIADVSQRKTTDRHGYSCSKNCRPYLAHDGKEISFSFCKSFATRTQYFGCPKLLQKRKQLLSVMRQERSATSF